MEKMASLSGVGETNGEVTTDHDVSVSVSVSCATEALARSSNVGMVMEASMMEGCMRVRCKKKNRRCKGLIHDVRSASIEF
jgi:hypothetical protein